MSVQAISWVIENSTHKSSSFVVLLMIANHAHSDGTGAYPSLETLARESRISVQQVINVLKKLSASGELTIERGVGPHGTNLYSLPHLSSTQKILDQIEQPGGQKILAQIRDSQSLDKPSGIKSKVFEPSRSAARFVLPDWVAAEKWEAFIEMRKKIRKPMTDYAMKLAVRTLDRLRAKGEDPAAVLDQSTFRSWQGLFPVKSDQGGNGNGHYESAAERRQRVNKERADQELPAFTGEPF